MRTHRIASRPYVQGTRRPLRLCHTARDLTDGAGLVLVRQLWDQLQLGARIDQRTAEVDRRYRSSLFIEVWMALLLYGGGVLDDLPRLAARGVAQLFGWRAVPDPTTFGRWLRRGGAALPELLDEVLWYLVRARWAVVGRPTALMLILDSTVVPRYGQQQAGAERGYNPTRRGRPSHHPLLAFTDQGDCLGVRWRGGAAHPAAAMVPHERNRSTYGCDPGGNATHGPAVPGPRPVLGPEARPGRADPAGLGVKRA